MARIVQQHREADRSRLVGAIGVGAALVLAVSACSSTPGGAPAAPPSAAPQSAAAPVPVAVHPRPRPHMPHIIGEITAEHGTTWTVRTKDGQNHKITVTPQTKFGTTKHPATQGQFPVGSTVRVNGPQAGDTISAAQIRHLTPKKKTPGPNAAAPGGPAG
jgi:hypothetical protein